MPQSILADCLGFIVNGIPLHIKKLCHYHSLKKLNWKIIKAAFYYERTMREEKNGQWRSHTAFRLKRRRKIIWVRDLRRTPEPQNNSAQKNKQYGANEYLSCTVIPELISGRNVKEQAQNHHNLLFHWKRLILLSMASLSQLCSSLVRSALQAIDS